LALARLGWISEKWLDFRFARASAEIRYNTELNIFLFLIAPSFNLSFVDMNGLVEHAGCHIFVKYFNAVQHKLSVILQVTVVILQVHSLIRIFVALFFHSFVFSFVDLLMLVVKFFPIGTQASPDYHRKLAS